MEEKVAGMKVMETECDMQTHKIMNAIRASFVTPFDREDIYEIANEMDDRHFCGSRLYKNSSTLTGGAFYNDLNGSVNEEIWLCPVTLFFYKVFWVFYVLCIFM